MKHVDKGWGWERWIVNKEEYCGKLLFFENSTEHFDSDSYRIEKGD